jgi:ribosomal protein L12E/L44/L45/RPP1/RPP2
MDPRASQPMNEEKLRETLQKMLEATGVEIEPMMMKVVLDIAMEMIKNERPEGISPRDMKNKDCKDFLSETLVAATSATMLISMQKDQLHSLLDSHHELTQEMKNLKPGDDARRKELTNELNQVKGEIKNVLKNLNQMDPYAPRRDAFDKQLEKDGFFDELTNPKEETKEVYETMKDSKPLSSGQKDTLTESLISLYGIDPRVTGAGTSPVMSVVGDQFGIPMSAPSYSEDPMAVNPLHGLTENRVNEAAEGRTDPRKKQESSAMIDVMEECVEQIANEFNSPKLTR